MSISPGIWSASPRLALGTERARRGSKWIAVGGSQASGPSYDPDASALFDRMAVQPDTIRKTIINQFIMDLKAAGWWALMKGMWVTAAHDYQAARLDWMGNPAYTLLPVNSPTFVADRYVQCDGSSSYFRTGFSPTVTSVNNAHLSVFIGSEINAPISPIGCRDAVATRQFLLLPRNGSNMNARVNQDTTGTSITLSSTANRHFLAWRYNATNLRYVVDAVDLGISGSNSTGKAPIEMYLGAVNQAGAASLNTDTPIMFASVGDGFVSSDDAILFTARVRKLLKDIGAISA